MRKLACTFLIAMAYVAISYGVFSGMGWSLVQRIYIPMSLSMMAWFYVLVDVVKNHREGIRKKENIIIAIISIILFLISFLV